MTWPLLSKFLFYKRCTNTAFKEILFNFPFFSFFFQCGAQNQQWIILKTEKSDLNYNNTIPIILQGWRNNKNHQYNIDNLGKYTSTVDSAYSKAMVSDSIGIHLYFLTKSKSQALRKVILGYPNDSLRYTPRFRTHSPWRFWKGKKY